MAPIGLLVRLSVFSYTGGVVAASLMPVSEYEGRRIAQIIYQPPSQPLMRPDLARLVPLKPGAPLHLADVQDTIKRLYTTGEYANIEVHALPVGSNGVTVVIRTTEQWFVGPVAVRGRVAVPPNSGQLANASRLELGQPFREEADLPQAIDGLRDLLERNGLYRNTVTPVIARDAEHQQISITFRVNSGARARLMLPVVIGDTRLPPLDLARAANYSGFLFFPWKRATAENVQSGLQNIRRKYRNDERLTASVRLLNRTYIPSQNRVRPVIEANGGPKIRLAATGARVSTRDLQKYVPVFDEDTVNQDVLVRGVANLRDYFQNKGYFEVQVGFQTAQAGPDLENITYTIQPGPRHRLVKVEVRGNRYFTTEDLRQRMLIQPAGFVYLRHGRYSAGLADRDASAIEALYRANGFRDVSVRIRSIDNYQGGIGNVAAIVEISEGPQYLVSSLTVDGMTLPDRASLLSGLTSVRGQPFSDADVALDRDYLLEAYQSRGYLDARFDWKMKPGPGSHEMALEYIIAEGMPLYVREVLFSGLDTTRQSLIRPHILLKAGDPLSWTTMGEMQRRLYNLGVFDQVDMAIQNPDGDTRTKYVLFHVTEGRHYSMGVGFGAQIARIGGNQNSLNDPTGTTGFAPHGTFEMSRLNLFGLGHSLNFRSGYSTLEQRVSLNYLIPRFQNVEGRSVSITGLYDNSSNVNTFTARRVEGSVDMSQRISKPTTVILRYAWRDVQANTLKINPLLIPLQSQPAQIALISANVIQDRRDNPVDAHRGFYNSADFALIDHYLGGNKNFLRFLGRNSYYEPIRRNLVLANNTLFGVINPFNTGGVPADIYVPLPERFFGGGSYTNRGFPDFQAGPRDLTTGFPVGGNALFFHQTELRFPFLRPDLGGVLFHDFGNVYTTLSQMSFRVSQKNLADFNYAVHAVGFGIRYQTPVGPVRLDLAYSINPPTFHGLQGTYNQLLFGGATPTIQSVSHFQFFISIGQAF